MKEKMGIFVSPMILCVMMDGLVLGEIEPSISNQADTEKTGTENGESIDRV
jgi:hypothetical protein